jgi:hypothetical protein
LRTSTAVFISPDWPENSNPTPIILWNRNGEILKYRRITDEKTFRIGSLPDCFRLLPSAGRGNSHEVHGTNRRLVQLLAGSRTEEEADSVIRGMPWRDWLDILAAWAHSVMGPDRAGGDVHYL